MNQLGTARAGTACKKSSVICLILRYFVRVMRSGAGVSDALKRKRPASLDLRTASMIGFRPAAHLAKGEPRMCHATDSTRTPDKYPPQAEVSTAPHILSFGRRIRRDLSTAGVRRRPGVTVGSGKPRTETTFPVGRDGTNSAAPVRAGKWCPGDRVSVPMSPDRIRRVDRAGRSDVFAALARGKGRLCFGQL